MFSKSKKKGYFHLGDGLPPHSLTLLFLNDFFLYLRVDFDFIDQ